MSKQEKTQPVMITEAEMLRLKEETAELLALEPKRRIRLQKSTNPKAPNYETVQINGYLFQIMRGVDVEVPEGVYQILVQSGLY